MAPAEPRTAAGHAAAAADRRRPTRRHRRRAGADRRRPRTVADESAQSRLNQNVGPHLARAFDARPTTADVANTSRAHLSLTGRAGITVMHGALPWQLWAKSKSKRRACLHCNELQSVSAMDNFGAGMQIQASIPRSDFQRFRFQDVVPQF